MKGNLSLLFGIFVWKMSTREQQFPGVEELSASRTTSTVLSISCTEQSSNLCLKSCNLPSSNELFYFKNEILCY